MSRRDVAVFGLFLALSLLLFAPGDVAATTRLIGATTADNSQQAWFLAWMPHALSSATDPFVSHDVNTPTGVNLMWNTWMPLPSVVLWPVTALAGPLAAFNSLVTLSTALSAFAMYVAARRWLRGSAAAIAAGLAYGFAPYELTEAYTGHANLALAFTPPLLLVLLDAVVVRRSMSARRGGLWLGVVVLVQLFTSEELLASELVAAGVVLGWLALLHRDTVSGRIASLVAMAGWALVVVVPVAAYPLWVQFFGPLVPTHAANDSTFFVTDLANVVLPTYSQGIDPSFAQGVAQHYLGNSGEWVGYVGLPMLLVAIATAARSWSRPVVRVCALSTATLLLVSFGSSLHVAGVDTHIPMPGWLLAHLPVFDNLLPARFGVYVALGTALLLAVAVDELPRTREAGRLALGAAVVLVAAYLPPLPFPTRVAPVPAFFTAAQPAFTGHPTLLVLPYAHDFDSADAMRWQAAAGISFAMPEGYVITRQPDGGSLTQAPPSATGSLFTRLAAGAVTPDQVSPADLDAVAGEVRAAGVAGIVLVDGTPGHGATLRVVTELVGRLGAASPVEAGGVTYWRLPTAA